MLAGAGAFASDDLARVTIDPRSRRQAVAGVQGGEGEGGREGREGRGEGSSTTLRPVPFLRGRLDTGSLIRTDYTQDCDRGICYQRIRRILPSRTSGFTLTYKHYCRANESKPLEAEANHIVNISFTSQSYPENSLLCGDNRLRVSGISFQSYRQQGCYDEAFAVKLSSFCTLSSCKGPPPCLLACLLATLGPSA